MCNSLGRLLLYHIMFYWMVFSSTFHSSGKKLHKMQEGESVQCVCVSTNGMLLLLLLFVCCFFSFCYVVSLFKGSVATKHTQKRVGNPGYIHKVYCGHNTQNISKSFIHKDICYDGVCHTMLCVCMPVVLSKFS